MIVYFEFFAWLYSLGINNFKNLFGFSSVCQGFKLTQKSFYGYIIRYLRLWIVLY